MNRIIIFALALLSLSMPAVSQLGSSGVSIVSPFISTGTTFTLGAGTGACSATSTLTGGPIAGSFLCTGTAGASTQVVNLPSAPNGWSCWNFDETSGVAGAQSAHTTTSATLKVTVGVTSDRIVFNCTGY